MLVPFDYQVNAINLAREAMRDPKRSAIICMLMGAGKTLVSLELMRLCAERGKRSLFLCDRRMLAGQAVERAREQGLDAGIIMAGHGVDLSAPCQFASKQTVESWIKRDRIDLPDFDLLIVDECFVGETEILTTMGNRRIDSMRPGDKVYCANGIGTVESVFCRPATKLYRLELSDGSTITCTGNHPFFTPKGWKEARRLERGTVLYQPEAMRTLWENDEAIRSPKRRKDVRKSVGEKGVLLAILRKEVEESDEQSSGTTKNESKAARNKAQADQERRQRAITSLAAACDAARAGGRLGVGVSDSDRPCQGRQRIPNVLQDRHSKQGKDDRHRTGRRKPHGVGETRTGREEDELLGIVRVVDVSSIERESAVPVFNLHVSGHPSYFANGVLVHNCHRAVSPAYVKLFNKWPNVFRIGLTATPVLGNGNGMGAYYGRLIQPIKPSELRALNRIVPVRAFAPHVPDLTGVKKDKDGDYSAKSLSERLTRSNLIGDVAGWWLKLAQGRPSIYFACDIAHAMAIRDEFRANGVTCEMICDQTPDDERDSIRNACESGAIKVVVNCDVLSEGIDWPFISCIGLVRPTKRLRRYLQNAGRGMRWLDGKIDCIIIDHAGCVPYHGFPDRDIEWPHDPCDNVDDLAKKKQASSLPMRCAKCSAMFQGSRTCPECGHVHIVEKKARDYAQKNGTLVEVNNGDLPQETQTLLAQRFWGTCIGTAIKYNRTAGMAASMFSDKFGIPPWEAKVTPLVSGSSWKRLAREVFPGHVKGKQKVQHGDAWEG